jgi:hypothetical protein
MTNCPQHSQMAPTVLSRRYCPSCSHVGVEKRLGSSSLHLDSDLTTANHTTFGTVALQDNAKIICKQAWRWSRPTRIYLAALQTHVQRSPRRAK